MSDLKDLVGLHMLDAVDFDNKSTPAYQGADYNEDHAVCRFRLGDTVWEAMEGNDDGYRSSMESFQHVDVPMVNIFPAIQVMAIHRTNGHYGGDDDVLVLIDVKTGKAVLEVGTHDISDYYPSYVATFDPSAMSINAGVEATK